MSGLFDSEGHIAGTSLQALKDGTLSEMELMLAAGHVAVCESCAEALAESFEERELLEAPAAFAQQVVNAYGSGRKSSRRQLATYSIKVTAAVCASLVLIFSGIFTRLPSVDIKSIGLKPPDLSFVNTVDNGLRNFSQNILNLEVFNYENEKK